MQRIKAMARRFYLSLDTTDWSHATSNARCFGARSDSDRRVGPHRASSAGVQGTTGV